MNPVFERSFRSIAAAPQTFTLRACVVAIPILLLPLAWRDVGGDPSSAARVIFLMSTIGVLAAVVLLTPLSLASTFVNERRDGKLDVLLASPLPAKAIVLAHWWSRVLHLVSFILPAMAICAMSLLLGGISLQQLAAAFLTIALTAAWTAAISIRAAALARTSGDAARRAFAGVLGWLVLLALCGSAPVPRTWLSVNPFLLLVNLGSPLPLPGSVIFVALEVQVLVALTITWLALRGAAAALRERWIEIPDGQGAGRTIPMPAPDRTVRRFAPDPKLLERDPLRWLESGRTPQFGIVSLILFLGVSFAYALFVFGLIGSRLELGVPQLHVFADASLIAALVLAGIRGAGSFHRDDSENASDVLHATPLGNAQLLAARLRTTVSGSIPWWGLSSVTYLAGVPGSRVALAGVLMHAAVSAVVISAFAAFAVIQSAVSPDTARAGVRVATGFVAMMVLAPLFLVMLSTAGVELPKGIGRLIHPVGLAEVAVQPKSAAWPLVPLAVSAWLAWTWWATRMRLPGLMRHRRPDDPARAMPR